MRSFIASAAAAAALLVPTALAVSPSLYDDSKGLAPVTKPLPGQDIVPGSYIVVRKPVANGHSAAKFARRTLASMGVKANSVYSSGLFQGFAANLNEEQVRTLRQQPEVASIEHNTVIRPQLKKPEKEWKWVGHDTMNWGLHVISHRAHMIQSPPQKMSYLYEKSAGNGTCVYIVDTGIDSNHTEFEGRVEFVADVTGSNNTFDIFGHGTHMAGLVGSKPNGVAPKTKLLSVKAIPDLGQGETAMVVEGLQKVFEDVGQRRAKECPNGVIVNLSLGAKGPVSEALTRMMLEFKKLDIFVVAAAGAASVDARDFVPANTPGICTVGDIRGHVVRRILTMMPFAPVDNSNWGSIIDIRAPAFGSFSAKAGGGYDWKMASSGGAAFVSGVAASLKSFNSTAGEDMCQKIVDMSRPGLIENLKVEEWKEHNRLLFTQSLRE